MQDIFIYKPVTQPVLGCKIGWLFCGYSLWCFYVTASQCLCAVLNIAVFCNFLMLCFQARFLYIS